MTLKSSGLSLTPASAWLGSIPGYTLSETAKGLVDMVMDEVVVEVGGGGESPISTDPSSFRLILRAITVIMLRVLAGHGFQPQCLPGLKPTKKIS